MTGSYDSSNGAGRSKGPLHEAAVAEFIRRKGVIRCPTACVLATTASVSEADKLRLQEYAKAKTIKAVEGADSLKPHKVRARKRAAEACVKRLLPLVLEIRNGNPNLSNVSIAKLLNSRGETALRGGPCTGDTVRWVLDYKRANEHS